MRASSLDHITPKTLESYESLTFATHPAGLSSDWRLSRSHRFVKELRFADAKPSGLGSIPSPEGFTSTQSLAQPPRGPSPQDNTTIGGAREDRTPDLLRARQALSQLSYGPRVSMVGLAGVEPATSPLSGVRSNQLSYRPEQLQRVRRPCV